MSIGRNSSRKVLFSNHWRSCPHRFKKLLQPFLLDYYDYDFFVYCNSSAQQQEFLSYSSKKCQSSSYTLIAQHVLSECNIYFTSQSYQLPCLSYQQKLYESILKNFHFKLVDSETQTGEELKIFVTPCGFKNSLKMLKAFDSVTPYLKVKPTRVTIDNFFFKLHYRFTFIILIIATVLVTSRQYIGEHIKCISDTIPEKVINSFCFITTTFTVVRHLNNTALDSGAIFQPGIGPYQPEQDSIKRHAYYQWVPFVLFGQALCFMGPHFLWKRWEGGRIKTLVVGLKMAGISKYISNKELTINEKKILSKEQLEERVQQIRHEVTNRMRLNRQWGIHLMTAEWLNWFNITVQIWATNKFLAGQFYSLGFKVLGETWDTRMDVLDVVFPKVTKCHFQKFGPSGTLQMHDTLCVMALNIINEKIYTILWFWFFFVLIMSSIAVIWRIFTLFIYKNRKFSLFAFSLAKPGRGLNRNNLYTVLRRCQFSNWMFLYFVASNLSEFLFNKVIYHLAEETSSNPINENRANQNIDIEKPPNSAGPSHIANLDMVDSPLLTTKEKDVAKVD